MVKRELTVKGTELLVRGLGNKKILLSRRNGVVLRNVNLDRVETKIVSRELGCVPSKWDEVSRESMFINSDRMLSNLK